MISHYKLEFKVRVDYSVVTAIDSKNNTVYMPVEEVKRLTTDWK